MSQENTMNPNALTKPNFGSGTKPMKCPAMVTIDLAYGMLMQHDGELSPREKLVAASLRMERGILEQLHQALPCEPVVWNGCLVCPLASAAGQVMNLLVAPQQNPGQD